MTADLLIDAATESALLGAVLTDSDAMDRLEATPSPEDFASQKNGTIWRAVMALRRAARPIDELTLSEKLQETGELVGIGGPHALTAFWDAVPLSANAPEYARRIKDLATRRALVAKAREIASRAADFSRDASELALEGAGAIAGIGATGDGRLRTLRRDVEEAMDRIDAVTTGKQAAVTPTGIAIYDEVLGGLQHEVLNGIGAQPSVGKSALMGRIIANIASRGQKVGLFSLEDRAVWLPQRIVAGGSGVAVRALKTQRLNEFQALEVGRALKDVWDWAENVYVEDRDQLSAAQIAARARQMIAAGAVAIFVDHMGEVELELGKGERHDLALSRGLQHLRNVAKTTRVPVVPLFHFARPMGARTEPRYTRPTSASWANSAGIERMLRVGVGLWLPPPPELVNEKQRADYARFYDPDEVVCTVLKQTDGDKDIDFAMRMHRPSGLIRNSGGSIRSGVKGYHEEAKS